MASVTGNQKGDVRLSQASMRTGIFALPVTVKRNWLEVKLGGTAAEMAGAQAIS